MNPQPISHRPVGRYIECLCGCERSYTLDEWLEHKRADASNFDTKRLLYTTAKMLEQRSCIVADPVMALLATCDAFPALKYGPHFIAARSAVARAAGVSVVNGDALLRWINGYPHPVTEIVALLRLAARNIGATV